MHRESFSLLKWTYFEMHEIKSLQNHGPLENNIVGFKSNVLISK